MVRDVIARGWIAAVMRGLDGLPAAEIDAVFARVGRRLNAVVDLARRTDSGSTADRVAAVESLIELTGVDATELIEFAAAAVRLGVHEAAQALSWTPSFAGDIERRAVKQLLEFDEQIAALLDHSETSAAGGR